MTGPAVHFRSLSDPAGIESLVSLSAKLDQSARWIRDMLQRGETRLAWCRSAHSDDGKVLAAHVFDSFSPRGPGDVPTFVQLLGHVDEAAAAALLAADLVSFGAQTVDARVVIDTDAPPGLRTLRESQPGLLARAGFRFEVARVRLHRPPRTVPPRPTGRLTFEPAASFPAGELLRIFAEVGDGSLDHGMRSARAEFEREGEAGRRLTDAQHRDHPPHWFVLGLDQSQEPVGYVQCARDGTRAILAELGVVESHRGHRYADELLAYATSTALDDGAETLTSDTDRLNAPMRAAFARAGYEEFAVRDDFRWSRPGSPVQS